MNHLLPQRGFESITNLFGVVRRRLWAKPGTAHIEMPDLSPREYDDFTAVLSEELEALDGVYWAAPNGATGRMVVTWDEEKISEEQLLEVASRVEDRFHLGVATYSDAGAAHPGDDEPLLRGLVRMGADVAGAAVGVTMKITRRQPGRRRFDMANLMSIVDNVPHIRKGLANRMGQASADVTIGISNPLMQGLGSGPTGPILDFGFQLARYLEAVDRRRTWLDREPELCSRPDLAGAPRREVEPRPIPVPDGPIEEYAEDVWNMSLGGFLVGLADTQELERAVTPLLDALPKPARYGRDAFAAGLSRAFARRGMLVMRPDAVRRLDRIDCVIVDDDIFRTGEWVLDRVVCPEGTNLVEAFRSAEALLDTRNPEQTVRDGDWALGPADDVDVDPELMSRLRDRGARGDFLALRHDGDVRALFSLRALTDPGCEALVDAIFEAGLELIVASDRENPQLSFEPDRVICHEGLHRFIRHIQRDHQVVAFIGDEDRRSMITADCSLGFMLRDDNVPWHADIIAADNLDDAAFFVEAIACSRRVSRAAAILAGAGAGIGALSAVRGLEKTRPSRVMSSVNLASLIALAYGTIMARRLSRRFQPTARPRIPWHRMTPEEVLQHLDSSEQGLNAPEVDQRRTDDIAPTPRPLRMVRAVGSELANPLTPILAGGAAVSAVVGSLADAGIVGTVIAFNGLVGGFERFRAEESIRQMARREAMEVTAIRDGRWTRITEEELVVGDVVHLEAGDVVPADCRILESHNLEVDESSLTGESLPVAKESEPSFSPLAAERTSMLYDGTAVVAGTTTAVVVATGADTELRRSRWAGSRRSAPEAQGVEARLTSFSDLTLPFAGISGGILMSLGVFRRRQLQELIGPAVNLAVGAVPEGLPLLATTAQLAASSRLSERNVIVHNPRAMEALGRVDTVCIDKTGTLTEGTLSFHGLCHDEDHCTVNEDRWSDAHLRVLRAALRATPGEPGEENGQSLPHATDRAIIAGAEEVGMTGSDWQLLHDLPFKTEIGFHATIGEVNGRRRIAVKGSPEEVLQRCANFDNGQGPRPMSDEKREELLRRARDLAGRGLRILACAEGDFEDRDDDETELSPEDVEELDFFGFVTLSDPLRPTSRDAVRALRRAGVSLLMLTGDHAETARRIAHEVGIGATGEVLTGDEIETMSNDELAEALLHTTVIARMTPAHKVRIVDALQRSGRPVAMTGDGGNDAAAIRRADAGIALGADASSAARDAADLVVTDARLETIVDAVIEGRAMWRSVRDAVSILIGGNLGEILFMLASGVVATIPALNARQLLLVNLFTDVAPAMAIALRPPPEVSPDELLHEGPEESLGEALERDIMWRALVTGSAGFAAWWLARHSFQKKRASTVGLLTIVTAQLGQTLTTAKPTLPVWIASLGSTAALLALIETPGISRLLGSRPLGPVGLTTAFGTAAAATAASLVIPRIPRWKQAITERLPVEPEPEGDEFFQEFRDFAAEGLRLA